MHDFAIALGFAPKVVAVYRAMGEPERTMVRMVMGFVRSGFHRPISSHSSAAGTDERITVRPWHVFEIILGEKLAVDVHTEAVSELCDLDAVGRG